MFASDTTRDTMEVEWSQGDKENFEADGTKTLDPTPPKLGESIPQQATMKGKQTSGVTDPRAEEGAVKNGNDPNHDSDSETALDGKKKKRRRRRHKGGKNHRRWKPYDKMSWQEKRALEEKETLRANQKREEAFASGHPVAPYNTTQFLMEDHFQSEAISPDLHRHNSKDSNGSNCTDSSSDYYDDDSENDGFIAKNFSDTYDNFHAERLSNMPKEELIKDYVEMEAKLERLENARGDRSSRESSDGNSISDATEESVDIVMFRNLKQENENLRKENERLKKELEERQKVSDCNDI